MAEDLLDYWVRLIKPLFPMNAWIVSRLSDDDYFIQIDWNLENEPRQPNKRSKKIQITISAEAIEDYLDKNKKDREESDLTMKKMIMERYKRTRPDRNAPASQSASTEKWLISRDVLNAY
jgi:hypothetical protein